MENKKLIILGNGFDLACGLKSRYADFFEKRITENINDGLLEIYKIFEQKHKLGSTGLNAPVYSFSTLFDLKTTHAKRKKDFYNIHEYEVLEIRLGMQGTIKASNLTFWDIVLFYFQKVGQINLEDIQWQNIEDRMLDFLTNEKTETPSFKEICRVINEDYDMGLSSWVCLHVASFLPDRNKKYQEDDFLQYLYDELRLFEKDFAEYIKTESSKDSYKHNAINKICEISGKSIKNFTDKIFSFNYTDPFSRRSLDVINVHGKAETDSILFGIDQEAILPSSEVYSFTKTFRQMTETKLAKNYKVDILPSKDEIEEIAFFGHSLSNLDYSYFQTIFDHYDVYDSYVKLVFYYERYGDKTTRDMELDLASKISQLLHAYSPSIDNEKKGRNLLHKLLLEKRLIIEEIN